MCFRTVQQNVWAAIIGFILIGVPSIVMLALSFDVVDTLQWGIRYDDNWHTLHTEDIRGAGRHFVGLGQRMIEFPRNLQYVNFGAMSGADGSALSCWTNDGQEVVLEMSFQYRITKQNIPAIYAKYGTQWHPTIVRISQAAIKDITTKFTTIEFFTSRIAIGAALKAGLQTRLGATCFVSVEYFQLRDIALPALFEDAIVKKLVQAQLVNTAANVQRSTVIRKDTEVILATANATVATMKAKAQADSYLTIQSASAAAEKKKIDIEASSYASLASTLALNSTDLLLYLWASSVKSLPTNTRATVGFPPAEVIV